MTTGAPFNPRTSSRRAVRVVAGGLHWLNQRHPWSHNDHYHGFVLRHLPSSRRRALDVGCGRGSLVAALAGRFYTVVGIDADPIMAGAAAARFRGDPQILIRQASWPCEVIGSPGSYDLITMVAVLHHLPLAATLHKINELLAPGGRFIVVGLARLESRRDQAVDLASALLNPFVGMIKHPRVARCPSVDVAMPVRPPDLSFDEIAAVASRLLPDARLRRQLFFRYTLVWTKPSEDGGINLPWRAPKPHVVPTLNDALQHHTYDVVGVRTPPESHERC